jgi:hypothetical protein
VTHVEFGYDLVKQPEQPSLATLPDYVHCIEDTIGDLECELFNVAFEVESDDPRHGAV